MATKYVKLPDGRTVAVKVPDDIESRIQQSMGESAAKDFGVPSRLEEGLAIADRTLRGGMLGLPGLAGDVVMWAAKNAPPMPGLSGAAADLLKIPQGSDSYESPSNALQTITGGPLREPSTEAGKHAGDIGAATIGGLAGSPALSLLRRGMIGFGSGVGGEVGEQLTDGSVAGTLGGAVIGGGLPAIISANKQNAEGMLRTSMEAMSESDWRRAKVTEAMLDSQNIPHLKSQLLGPSSSVDDIVFQASANPSARPTILDAIRNSIPRAEGAVRRWTAGNLPPNIAERRGMFADIQEMASNKGDSLVDNANAAYARNLPGTPFSYTSQNISSLGNDLVKLAVEKYGQTSEAGKALLRFVREKLPHEGKNAAPAVREEVRPGIYKHTPAQEASPVPGMEADHLNNLLKDLNTLTPEAGWGGLPAEEIKSAIRAYSPEFAAARGAKTDAMRRVVEPFRQGLAGDIARMGGGPQQGRYTATRNIIQMVFPKDKAQPQAISKLADDVGTDAVGWLLSDHIESALQNTASMAKGNAQAPADFVQAIAGNRAQTENLNAALRKISEANGVNPFQVRNGLYSLLNAMKTFKDVKVAPGISGSNIQFEAGKNTASALAQPAGRAQRFFWERASDKTWKQIAQIVTSPDGLKKLEAIAKAPQGTVKESLINSILTETMLADENQE